MNVIISNEKDDVLSSLEIDVIKKIRGEFAVEEIVSLFENFFYERLIIDITSIKGYEDVAMLQNLTMNLEPNKIILLLDGGSVSKSNEYISKLISIGIYNFTSNANELLKLIEKPNTYREVVNLHQIENKKDNVVINNNNKTRVIGLKNLTIGAGSSTLIYMIKKELKENYIVRCIEVNRNDFKYFGDKEMISTSGVNLGEELLRLKGNVDLILVDLNDSNLDKLCSEVIYLIEPSIIKINDLVSRNRNLLQRVSGKKVVLNKCLLTDRDISVFEMETGIKVFASIPPLNDRIDNDELNDFLIKLGFVKQKKIEEEDEVEEKQRKESKLFGIFKRKS